VLSLLSLVMLTLLLPPMLAQPVLPVQQILSLTLRMLLVGAGLMALQLPLRGAQPAPLLVAVPQAVLLAAVRLAARDALHVAAPECRLRAAWSV
jgi:hypothetical protein